MMKQYSIFHFIYFGYESKSLVGFPKLAKGFVFFNILSLAIICVEYRFIDMIMD